MTAVMSLSGSLLLAGLLEVLLQSGEIGLRSGDVAGLQILRELRDGSGDGTGVLRRGGSCRGGGISRWRGRIILLAAGKILLQGGEIALRLREITGLKILPQLRKTLVELLQPVLCRDGIELGEDAVANSRDRHERLL